ECSGTSGPSVKKRKARWHVIISAATQNLIAAIDDLKRVDAQLSSEISGLPVEAAPHAVSCLTRAEATGVVLLTSEPAMSACRANRNPRVRAAEVRDARTLAAVRRQLGANLLCIDPSGRSYFELRKLLADCTSGPVPQAPANWTE